MDETPTDPTPTDKRKQSLYFPGDMLDEIRREAMRQDRSLSWLLQQAWRLARPTLLAREGATSPALQE